MKICTLTKGNVIALSALFCFLIAASFAFAQPTVTITSPSIASTTVSVGSTVNFTAQRNGNNSNWTGGNSNFTYVWNFVSGPAGGLSFSPASTTGTGNSSSTTATFTVVGTYTVSCTGTEGGGGLTATSAITTIIVTPPPPPAVVLTPSGSQTTFSGGSITFTAGTSNFTGSGTINYIWSVSPGAQGVDYIIPAGNSSSKTITFNTFGNYSVSVTASRGAESASGVAIPVAVYNANLWATSNNGTSIAAFGVNSGTYIGGPTSIFTPVTGTGSSTAALAISSLQPGVNIGDPFTPYFYWLPNTTGNNGVVEVYGATAAGTNQTLIGTLDLNGASATSLGFVRLGMGPDGVCYMIAGDGSTTIYLASFKPNGITVNASLPAADQLKVVDNSITITGTGVSAADFQNGDLAVLNDPNQGGVKIYALTNVTGGSTKMFIGKPNGTNTVLTKQWDLVSNTGGNFTGSVNGVAFDLTGSMYLSTANGIYFVNAATVNSAGPGTVITSLVRSVTGIQDLASNAFPNGSTLPVKLISFNGKLDNNVATLNWETANETNFDYFEIERSANAREFQSEGRKYSFNTSSRSAAYNFSDDLTAENGKVFYYRLRMTDKDGKYEYSNILALRRDQKQLKTLILTPNPVAGSTATARIEAASAGTITLRIIDANGRLIQQQANKINAGVNTIQISNINKLQPGNYILQMINDGEITSAKFSKMQ